MAWDALTSAVVPGVNTHNLGELVRYAAARVPAVRAVHFQPVSYFGRHPGKPDDEQRYTLDRLMADIAEQAGISIESFMPSRCDHPLCGFHANYIVRPDGSLRALSSISAMEFEPKFQPVTFIAPSRNVLFLSGHTRSGSTNCLKPKPEQVGHAPYTVLNENIRGSISSMETPQSGQA